MHDTISSNTQSFGARTSTARCSGSMRMQGKRHSRCRLPSAAALLLLGALLHSLSLPSPYLASASLTTASSSTSSASPLVPPVRPFELRDVSLAPDSFQYRAAASNTEYLLQLEPDRMLWAFRNHAKLPTPGVPFYGSWEDPGCELRCGDEREVPPNDAAA